MLAQKVFELLERRPSMMLSSNLEIRTRVLMVVMVAGLFGSMGDGGGSLCHLVVLGALLHGDCVPLRDKVVSRILVDASCTARKSRADVRGFLVVVLDNKNFFTALPPIGEDWRGNTSLRDSAIHCVHQRTRSFCLRYDFVTRGGRPNILGRTGGKVQRARKMLLRRPQTTA